MSATLPPSALDPNSQAFPILTHEQIDRIRSCGRVRAVQPGEVLFEPSDSDIPFFVLLSGAMEIVQPTTDGKQDGERTVARHGPGEFTGEINMISGQRSLVRGRVTDAGEF